MVLVLGTYLWTEHEIISTAGQRRNGDKFNTLLNIFTTLPCVFTQSGWVNTLSFIQLAAQTDKWRLRLCDKIIVQDIFAYNQLKITLFITKSVLPAPYMNKHLVTFQNSCWTYLFLNFFESGAWESFVYSRIQLSCNL